MTFPRPYRSRPARLEDLDALVRLFEARDRVDVGFVDQSRDEIVEDWTLPRFDLARDTVVAEAPDGSIVAYGIVVAIDPSVQISGMGKVHPEHSGLGLGAALVADTERRAIVRLPRGVSAPFRFGVPQSDDAATDLLSSRGYRHVRSFWHMQRGLPADEIETSEPEGIALRSGTVDDEPVAHRVLDETFREHFGYEAWTFEDWQEAMHGTPGYEPPLMVLALADGEPVGVSVNLAADDGAGWVADLGVLAPFRGRGVGRALLTRSFAELAARGHHEVRLGVDSENATGATRLYEGVGMTVRRRYDVYEKQLTGA